MDSKLSSLRKALPLRLAESEPVVVVERAVSHGPPAAAMADARPRPRSGIPPFPLAGADAGPGRAVAGTECPRLRRELDRLCPPGPRYVCYDSPSQAALAGRLNEACTIYLAIDDRTKTVTGEPIPGEEAAERELLWPNGPRGLRE